MRARGLRVLRALHERGAVTWCADAVELLLPEDPDAARIVHEDAQTIWAVLRRAAGFRQQLLSPSTEPFLRYRVQKGTAEGCPSCGRRMTEHEFLRCDLCALGAELALATPSPPGSGAPR